MSRQPQGKRAIGLSWRGEKLLLWLVLQVGWGGSVEAGADALAKAVGLTKRQDIYLAATELAEAGWVTKEGGRAGLGGRFTLRDEPESVPLCFDGIQFHRKSLPEVTGVPKVTNTAPRIDVSFFSNRGAVKTTVVQDAPAEAVSDAEATEPETVYPQEVQGHVPATGTPLYPERVQGMYPQEEHVPATGTPLYPQRDTLVPVTGTSPSRVKPLLTRIVEADRMPGGDDKLRGPFQDRRRAQVPLVQEAWAQFFPNTNALTAANAKQMLTIVDDFAEDLYEQFRDLAQNSPNHPLSYVLSVLKKNQAARPASSAPASSGNAAKDEPVVTERHEPSAEYMARMREGALLGHRMGIYTITPADMERYHFTEEELAR